MRISDWSSDVCSSDRKLSIGASIGIAFGPSDGASAHNLIRSADLALYRAKDAARSVVRRYLPAMHREAEERRQLETEHRSALKNGDMTLAYKPIIASNTPKIDGTEALPPWPDRNSVVEEKRGEIQVGHGGGRRKKKKNKT